MTGIFNLSDINAGNASCDLTPLPAVMLSPKHTMVVPGASRFAIFSYASEQDRVKRSAGSRQQINRRKRRECVIAADDRRSGSGERRVSAGEAA
jgi:hypothetical protein